MKNKLIGFVSDDKLFGGSSKKGHYVYIKKRYKDYAIVNLITSLEKGPYEYNVKKLKHIRLGKLFAIPYNKSNFNRWSAIDLLDHNVKLSDINFKNKKYINIKNKRY